MIQGMTETSISAPVLIEHSGALPKKRFLQASLALLGVGAATELYATAAIASERVPGNASVLVALGTVSLVASIGASLGSMPEPLTQELVDSPDSSDSSEAT